MSKKPFFNKSDFFFMLVPVMLALLIAYLLTVPLEPRFGMGPALLTESPEQ